MELTQTTCVHLSAKDVADLELSIPHWSALAQEPFNRGTTRHGGVTRAVPHIPADYKVSYEQHALPYHQHGRSNLLVVGARNAQQNILSPVYHADREPRLLRRADEPWATESYHALLYLDGGRLAIEEVRFEAGEDGEPRIIEVVDQEGVWRARSDVVFAVIGQPLLCDGHVPSLAAIAAKCTDFRHVWRLPWEHQNGCPWAARAHTELTETLLDHLCSRVDERGQALVKVAERHGLAVEDHYLHSSIGLDREGGLVFVARHGSLADIGRAQMEAGAANAILLDSGGSVGYRLFSTATPKGAPISTGSYFRSRAHAVLVVLLRDEFLEPPFRRTPGPVASPHSGRAGVSGVTGAGAGSFALSRRPAVGIAVSGAGGSETSDSVIDPAKIHYAFTRQAFDHGLIHAEWSARVRRLPRGGIYVRTDDGLYLAHKRSLKDLEKRLPDAFFRINDGVLVNLRSIAELELRQTRRKRVAVRRGAEAPHTLDWLVVARRPARILRDLFCLPVREGLSVSTELQGFGGAEDGSQASLAATDGPQKTDEDAERTVVGQETSSNTASQGMTSQRTTRNVHGGRTDERAGEDDGETDQRVAGRKNRSSSEAATGGEPAQVAKGNDDTTVERK